MTRKLGTITLGQAPRPDLTPMLEAALPADLPRLHVGVVDGMDKAAIAERFPVREGEPVLISRLLDGTSVVMDKAGVEAAVQGKVEELEAAGCTTILLWCTGKFAELEARRAALIEPQKILMPCLAALTQGRRVGILVPLPEQIQAEQSKWANFSAAPICAAVSPYQESDDAVAAAARDLRGRGAEILMTDCMGFVEHHRRAATAASGLPLILSSALIAKLVAEVV
ncbi:AroM family protein [Consotaella aegiceratis]|uniref:AroM family protein n=1 Tax=Consotaella aegiceratis TaxID=3097961 RepID=UPI002F4144EC